MQRSSGFLNRFWVGITSDASTRGFVFKMNEGAEDLGAVPTSEALVSISEDPECQIIECLFPGSRTPLNDIAAISALLALGVIPKAVVIKNDDFPTVVSIIPRKGWDIRELANELCLLLETEDLIVRKFHKTKVSGEFVVTPVSYF